MSRFHTIVIHCTATREGQEITVDQIRKWHTDPKPRGRGWSDIGYHFVVMLDGSVEVGRPLTRNGAHVLGHNTNTIGIVYVGGVDENLTPKDTRTPEQKEAINCHIENLLHYHKNIKEIKGHRDFSEDTNKNGVLEPFEWMKVCPCYNAIEEHKHLLEL